MKIKKYGGSSLKNKDSIELVANDIKKDSDKQIVVVSALYGYTDSIIQEGLSLSKDASKRELDQLQITGEIISASLLTIKLQDIGVNAISLNALSAGIIATNEYTDASILSINKDKILQMLNTYDVLVITGFQGVTLNNDFVTLGRGGSDTTAAALASIFHCDCFIYKDVDGILKVDPKLNEKSKINKTISYDEINELSLAGSKVLSPKSANILLENKVKAYVYKVFTNNGTEISKIEHEGLTAIHIKENIKVVKGKGDFNYYMNNNHYNGVKYLQGSKNSLVSLIGSFFIKNHFDDKIISLLKEEGITPHFMIIKENLIEFEILNDKKEKIIKRIIDNFSL